MKLKAKQIKTSKKINHDNKKYNILKINIKNKNAAIEILRKQLKIINKSENHKLIEIHIMTSKLSSIRIKEEKREKELRNIMKYNESLIKELKVTHFS